MADAAVVTQQVGSNSPDASTNLGKAIAAGPGGALEVHSGTGGAGVIGITAGTVIITDSGVAALTLALPVAGAPSAGGNDGQRLMIISTTAHAHTVTTPSDGLNGADHIATFSAAAGDVLELVAYDGSWWMVGEINITLS